MITDQAPTAPPLPRAFWLLLCGSFINRLGTFIVPFLALFLTAERGFTFAQAGATASLMGLGSILSGPIGGTIADRAGRKVALTVGLSLSAIFILSILYARTPAQIALAVFCCGLGDMFRPGLLATIADLVPPAQRPRAFGLTYWAHNMGFAVAMPIGGALASGGYKTLFYGDSGTSLIFAAVILLGIKETRPIAPPAADGAPSGTSGNSVLSGMLVALTDGPFIAFVLLFAVTATVFLQSMSSLPLAMRDQGISTATYGQVIAVNGFLIVALQPFAERLVGFLRPARRLALSMFIVGIGFGLQALCNTPLQYVLAISLWTLGEIMLAGIGPSVVAHLAPVHLRGSYQGVHGMSWSSAALLAPLLGPRILAASGATTLWILCAVASTFAALGILAVGKRLERAGTEI